MNMPSSGGIYAITDCENHPVEELLEKSEKILRVGISLFQYRNKSNEQHRKKELALALKSLCQNYKTPFIVNDDLTLAKEISADGIHLGRNDPDIKAAREELGAKIIGISCYNDIDRAINAEAEGADYIAFGSFFSSRTKPDATQANIETLSKAKSSLQIPVVAIGGITPENGKELVNAKADFLAIISGLFSAADTSNTTRKYVNLFKKL